MGRNDWKFEYTAIKLAEAVQNKVNWHTERLEWWKNKKNKVFSTIRQEGIEIDEKISLEFKSPKSRDWDQGAQVMVRNDLQKDLDECMEKLKAHTRRLNEYIGWQQILNANLESHQFLDIDDWLFFFGTE